VTFRNDDLLKNRLICFINCVTCTFRNLKPVIPFQDLSHTLKLPALGSPAVKFTQTNELFILHAWYISNPLISQQTLIENYFCFQRRSTSSASASSNSLASSPFDPAQRRDRSTQSGLEASRDRLLLGLRSGIVLRRIENRFENEIEKITNELFVRSLK
jgi:hypothetical protein